MAVAKFWRASAQMFQTSWEDLAAEWAAMNSEQTPERSPSSQVSFSQGVVTNISPVMVETETPDSPEDLKDANLSVEIQGIEEMWDKIDKEILQMQQDAREALSGLEDMEKEFEVLTTEMRDKDDNYVRQIRDMETRGNQLENDLRKQLECLLKEYDEFRSKSEEQQQIFKQEAEKKQNALRAQVDTLQADLYKKKTQLQLEQSQLVQVKAEKTRVDKELQNFRDDVTMKMKELENRLQDENEARERERTDFETRLRDLQEEATQRLDASIQKAKDEKEMLERAYTGRLENLSEELKTATANLAEAQKIVDEKQKYIERLEPAVSNLDEWIQESWLQFNRIQDAVGLPVTALGEGGQIPGVETLETEAQNLIEHLRSRERYFEDAIYDIQKEMLDKEHEAKENLRNLEQEYEQYRLDKVQELEDSRQDAASIKREMELQLTAMEDEYKKESERAEALKRARQTIESDMDQLKKEAAYVIDQLEKQLKYEKEARQEESEKAEKALDKVGDLSVEKIQKVIEQGRERLEATEKRLSTKIAQSEKELRRSKLTSSVFVSVALTSLVVSGMIMQGIQSDSGQNSVYGKQSVAVVEQLKETRKSPPFFQLNRPSQSARNKEIQVDTSTDKKFYYAIKEREGTAGGNDETGQKAATSSKGDKSTTSQDSPSTPSPSADAKESAALPLKESIAGKTEKDSSSKEKLAAKSKAEPEPRPVFAIKAEASKNVEVEKSGKSLQTSGSASDKGKVSQVPGPATSDGKVRTYLAIKEETMLETPPQAPAPAQTPNAVKSYLAIKEEGMVIYPKLPTNANTEAAMPSPELPTVSRSEGAARPVFAIKEGGITDEMSDTQSSSSPKKLGKESDNSLNNPLLQQALAPAATGK